MNLINADVVKKIYREAFTKNLIDKDRNIDLSHYANEPCNAFDKFIDNIPKAFDIDGFKNEIKSYIDSYKKKNDERFYVYDYILQMINYYSEV